MKTQLALLVAVAAAVGCSHTRPYAVKLESDPPGARVFMQSGALKKKGARDFLGTTPCETTIIGDKQGHFLAPQISYASDYVGGNVMFTFDPPASGTNLFPHSQTYRTHTEYVGGDKIPHAVFFDMTKP